MFACLLTGSSCHRVTPVPLGHLLVLFASRRRPRRWGQIEYKGKIAHTWPVGSSVVKLGEIASRYDGQRPLRVPGIDHCISGVPRIVLVSVLSGIAVELYDLSCAAVRAPRLGTVAAPVGGLAAPPAARRQPQRAARDERPRTPGPRHRPQRNSPPSRPPGGPPPNTCRRMTCKAAQTAGFSPQGSA